jgi:hypothetical protein
MPEHSSSANLDEGPISGRPKVWVGPLDAIRKAKRDPSRRWLAALARHRRELAPPIDAPQADLAAHHEAEEEEQRRVLARWSARGELPR